MATLTEVTEKILAFRDERDWAQFHTPRNLAAAIAIEAAELQESLLWKSDTEVLAALRPGLDRVDEGLLIGISSPYARRGALPRTQPVSAPVSAPCDRRGYGQPRQRARRRLV